MKWLTEIPDAINKSIRIKKAHKIFTHTQKKESIVEIKAGANGNCL
jgi:hypothetical protein